MGSFWEVLGGFLEVLGRFLGDSSSPLSRWGIKGSSGQGLQVQTRGFIAGFGVVLLGFLLSPQLQTAPQTLRAVQSSAGSSRGQKSSESRGEQQQPHLGGEGRQMFVLKPGNEDSKFNYCCGRGWKSSWGWCKTLHNTESAVPLHRSSLITAAPTRILISANLRGRGDRPGARRSLLHT